jgi:hypothetical protein
LSTRDPIQNWSSIAVGAATVLLAGYLTLESTNARPRQASSDGGSDASQSSSSSQSQATASAMDASNAMNDFDASGALVADLDAGLGSSSGLSLALDAASLPTSGPRTVKVGVVLVQWQGAENAGTNTRPKADALNKAQELATLAKTDFRRAVTQGDPGSAEDIGRIPRGTLDPRTEAVLFTLPSGEVSDVIETQRGFWIVKRLD